MKTQIKATVPVLEPPLWAVLQRQLFDLMDEAADPFLARYVHNGGAADGELIWREGGTGSRDGADDFYESVYNWPLLYLLGGGEHLLHHAQRVWDGITRQLTRAGMVRHEYELGYDQFHQGESYIFFYLLCLADPANPANRARAERFARFYLGDDPTLAPAAQNYDPAQNILRAPHNGSGGPRWGTNDQAEPSYGWAAGMRVYGLPFADVEGIEHYDDLKDPALARAMGQAMHERMGQGDVAGNLIVTSLVANAFLLTGDEIYRDWIVRYVDGWIERAAANGGLLPDNVGLDGRVGATLDGKWYGGLYGWTWPHGYYNIGMAATVAGANAWLLTGDERYLDLPRSQYDQIWALGSLQKPDPARMSLAHHWLGQLRDEQAADGLVAQAYLVPYRYGDRVDGSEPGWFDYQPLSPVYPTAIWNLSMDAVDWERIEALRATEGYDWRAVKTFRNKEECGHEQPWLRYLAGDNPDYPIKILQAAHASVRRRLALIATDDADLAQVNIHHWQEHNPIVTEALVQLTLGAPQFVYNGGLLHCRVRYFDVEHQRPGLPRDVAALVEGLAADRTVLRLVNLNPLATRTVVVQAGGFAEHRFGDVEYTVCTSDYPGSHKSYAVPPVTAATERVAVNDTWLTVELPPATEIVLDLETIRYCRQPTYPTAEDWQA